ncbi:MAG: hypothetical protein ACTS5I_14930, partial [Rhodanobacter sp.]
MLLVLMVLPVLQAHAAVDSTPERVDAIMRDFHQHGYPSASDTIARLRHATDAPGPDAPLQQRQRFQTAILYLALQGRHPQALSASMAALERMATQEDCQPCRFDTLLGRAHQALNDTSPAAAKVWLDQAQSSLPAGDRVREEALLVQQTSTEGLNGKFNKAMALAVKASALAHALGHVDVELRLLAEMSGLNASVGDLERAESTAMEALTRAEALNFVPIMAFAYLQLSHAYSLKNDRAQQLAALTEALRLSDSLPELTNIKLLSLNNLADYHLDQPGQEQLVLSLASRADALAHSAGLERFRPIPMANIGIALTRMGRLDEGLNQLKQAMALAESRGMATYVIAIGMELVKTNEKAGRYKDSLAAFYKVDEFQKQVTLEAREKAMIELQEKYAGERKSQEIRQLSADNALRRAEVAAKTWQLRLWAALAALLVLSSVMLARRIRRARAANNQLEVANATLAEQSSIDPLTRAYNRRHCQALMA